MQDFWAIVGVLVALGVINILASVGVKKGILGKEVGRKVVHVGMGLVCLVFPWVFDSVFSVQVLAALAVISLLIVRWTGLRNSVGSGLFAVKRLSIGELLFPVAVAWLFTLGWENPLLYCISLLLLTLADTVSALAGIRFGKKVYTTTAAMKSVEGSVAFFGTAFLCVAVPLYLWAELDLIGVLIVSMTVALFIMAVEGAAGHGLDNLLIPLGSFLLLDYYVGLSTEEVFGRSVMLILLLSLLLATHRRHRFNGGAILCAMLFGFASFILGGWACLISVMVVFLRHLWVQRKMPDRELVVYSLDVIAFISMPTLFWVTLGRGGVLDADVAQFGFVCTMALISYLLHTGTQRHLYLEKPTLFSGFLMMVLVLMPGLILLEVEFIYYLSFFVLGAPLAWLYFYWRKGPDEVVVTHWFRLFVLASFGSGVGMIPILI